MDSKLPTCDGGERMMTKAKILQNQSKNMATMASRYLSIAKIQDAFLADKVENQQWTQEENQNQQLDGVILEEEFLNTS